MIPGFIRDLLAAHRHVGSSAAMSSSSAAVPTGWPVPVPRREVAQLRSARSKQFYCWVPAATRSASLTGAPGAFVDAEAVRDQGVGLAIARAGRVEEREADIAWSSAGCGSARCWRRRPVHRAQPEGQPARHRYLKGRAGSPAIARASAWLRAAGLAHAGRGEALRRPPAGRSGPGAPQGRDGKTPSATLRLVPRPGDVPDPRRRRRESSLRPACRRQQAKYLNSPETPGSAQRGELYGLYERASDAREGPCAGRRGYMDVVALAQSASRTRWPCWHGLHRRPLVKLFRFTDSWCSASTATPPAGAAGRALEAALPHAHRPAQRAVPLPAARARPRQLRARAGAAFRAWSSRAAVAPAAGQAAEGAPGNSAPKADRDAGPGAGRWWSGTARLAADPGQAIRPNWHSRPADLANCSRLGRAAARRQRENGRPRCACSGAATSGPDRRGGHGRGAPAAAARRLVGPSCCRATTA